MYIMYNADDFLVILLPTDGNGDFHLLLVQSVRSDKIISLCGSEAQGSDHYQSCAFTRYFNVYKLQEYNGLLAMYL